MGLGTHWEHEKNAALLELDRRNKNLESKLSETSKEADAVSSQMDKMQQSLLHAIHEAFEKECLRRSVTLNRGPVAPAKEDLATGNQGMASVWEWQKNRALLELENRNKQLACLLKSKDAENEQDKELLEEGFVRGKECMRLYAQVRGMQGSIVLQAQRISNFKRLITVLSCWRHLVKKSRKTRLLGKAESFWDRHVLRRSFATLVVHRAKSLTTKKLSFIAWKHRAKIIMQHGFQSWVLSIQSRKYASERLSIFRVLQKYRLTRAAFAAWQLFSQTLLVKLLLNRKAELFYFMHRIQRSFRIWKGTMLTGRVYVSQADIFCKQSRLARSFQTWVINVQESIMEKIKMVQTEQHAKTMILRKLFKFWQHFSHLRIFLRRRLNKLIFDRTRRMLLFIIIGWRQYVKNNKEVRIWRGMLLAKQKQYLRQSAFDSWKMQWTRRRLILRFQTRKSSRLRLAVLKSWFRLSEAQNSRRQYIQNMLNRTQQRHVKDMFNRWLMFQAEARRLALLKDAKILQARLELSQEDLQGAGVIQAEMTKIVKHLEKEKTMMIRNISVMTARTPAWTSGFLDAELRWSFPQGLKGSVPSGRVGHTAVALQLASKSRSATHIVMIGGYNGYDPLDEISVFDTAVCTWKKPKLTVRDGAFPRSIQHHTACTRHNRIVIFGGFDGREDFNSLSILEFSSDGDSCEWSHPEHRLGILPGPLSQHSSCLSSDGNHMVVFGGYRSSVGHLNEIWILDLQWMDWHAPDYYGDPPLPRRGHKAVIIEGKMYVFGGYDGKSNLCDLHTLNLETMEWNLVKTQGNSPSPRRHHSMEAVGRHFLVYGGYDGNSYLEDVYSFDTETCIWKCWTMIKPQIRPDKLQIYRRSMHAMVPVGQRLVILGGIHEYGPLNDMLYLENGAAIDGLDLEKQLAEARNKVQTLQESVAQYELALQQKVADLAVAYSKIAECQTALKIEAGATQTAMTKQRVLIQKLKKARKKST